MAEKPWFFCQMNFEGFFIIIRYIFEQTSIIMQNTKSRIFGVAEKP